MANSPIIYGPTGSLFIGTPQGASGTVLTNDGAGNLTWASAGSNSPTVFNFSNNQSSLANVTGFLVTSTTAFVSDMSILRTTSSYTTLTPGLDTSFDTNLGTGFNDLVNSSAVQTNQKILVGGNFTALNGTTANYLVRLNSDGTQDTAFYTNLGTSFNSSVYSVAVSSSQQILVAGNFTTFNGNARNYLVRLNSDGTEDTTFYTNLGTSFNSPISVVYVQADQKILVGGNFTNFNGNSRNHLVRLNSDGTEDTAFYTNLGGGFNSVVFAITEQSNAQLIIGGAFSSFNAHSRNYLLRLNSDGTEDTAFYTNLGTGFNNPIYAVAVESDQKILVGGVFTSLNATTYNSLVRLNTTGAQDSIFNNNLGTGFSSSVRTIAVQSNQQLVIGGAFTSFNGNTRDYTVRINPDGTEDTSYYSSLGITFNSQINSIVVQSNQQLLIGGQFTNSPASLVRYGVITTIPATNITSVQTIKGVYDAINTTWTIQGFDSLSLNNKSPGVSFSMTSSGQLQYTSTFLSSSASNVMTFTIEEL